MKVDYTKIYEYLNQKKGKVVSASSIAYGVAVDRIYGSTMAKLVRDGAITPCALKGYYKVN